MTSQSKTSEYPARNRQRGQSLAFVAALLPILLGMCAIVIDLGYAYFSYQQLQAACQAAALAGGAAIPNTSAPTATTAALNYSALTGKLNAHSTLQNVTMSVSLACVPPSTYPTMNLPLCAEYPSCPSGCNMIQVQETAKVPTFFGKLLGFNSIPLSVTAVAAAKGGQVPPYHVMLVLDATPSMGEGTDTGCTQNGTSVNPEQCAEYGVQTLLGELDPCSNALATCSPGSSPGSSQNPDDQVGLMIFPGLCSSTTSGLTSKSCPELATGSTLTNTVLNATYDPDEYACSATIVPAFASYNNNPDYIILGFQSNYRYSDTSGLNTTSNLFKTVGAGTNNCGIIPEPTTSPNGLYDTFYAGAIQAAQDYLTLNNTVGIQNVIIFLSDGDANTTTGIPQTATCNAGNRTATQVDMCGNVAQVDGPCAAGTAPCNIAGITTGIYPPLNDCEQAVQAANYAKQSPNNTLIYSISYGSETTGCRADQTTYSFKPSTTTYKGDGNYPTPCSTMQGISSTPLTQYFFSIPQPGGSGTTICSGAVSITSLNQVFSVIGAELTVSRLVPSGDF